MARVDFAFGAPDRLRMACTVAQRHYAAGRALVVYSRDAQTLARIDRLLWSFEPAAFLPHVAATDPLAPATPVWLADEVPAAPPSGAALPAWLINLDADCPPGIQAYERVLEIVSDDPEDRQAARARWRAYQAAGHDLHAHDVSGRA